jgi:hypothetical protein
MGNAFLVSAAGLNMGALAHPTWMFWPTYVGALAHPVPSLSLYLSL